MDFLSSAQFEKKGHVALLIPPMAPGDVGVATEDHLTPRAQTNSHRRSLVVTKLVEAVRGCRAIPRAVQEAHLVHVDGCKKVSKRLLQRVPRVLESMGGSGESTSTGSGPRPGGGSTSSISPARPSSFNNGAKRPRSPAWLRRAAAAFGPPVQGSCSEGTGSKRRRQRGRGRERRSLPSPGVLTGGSGMAGQ